MNRHHPICFTTPAYGIGRPPGSLSTQANTLIHQIQSHFAQKQSRSPHAHEIRDFRLGFVIKKTLLTNESGSFPYIRIDLGLIGPSAFMERDKYAKAAALLRQAKREVLQQEAITENISVHGPSMYRCRVTELN